jgi:GT2 family glycosyltransferase
MIISKPCSPISHNQSDALLAAAGNSSGVPRVAILVLNWNAWEITCDCLRSLAHLDYDNYEVAVIDNGSTDGSVQKLRHQFANLTMLENGANLGFAAGNNVGVRYALERGAQYIFLLNNDTVVSPSCVSAMVRIAQSDSKIGILNPKIYYSDPPDRIWYAGGSFSPWFGFARHNGMKKRSCDVRGSTREVTFITGCAFLIKAEVIRRIGLLDESFFMVCEDTDWSIRARRAGFKAVYVAEAEIRHRESYTITNKKGKAFRDYYNFRNTLLLARKHARFYHWPSFVACLLSTILYRVAGYSVLGQFERITALCRGLRDGMRDSITANDMQMLGANLDK